MSKSKKTYRITVRLSASQRDALATWALKRDYTRKTRGKRSRSPDMGRAAREALAFIINR